MTSRARIMTALLSAAVIAFGVTSASAGSREKAEALIGAMGLEEQWTVILAMFSRRVVDETPELAPYRDIVVDYAEEKVGWSKIRDEVVDVYAKQFTDEELDAIRSFFLSPAGKKWREVTPVLSDEIDRLVRKKFDEDLPLLELRMKNRELDLLAEHDVFWKPPDEAKGTEAKGSGK